MKRMYHITKGRVWATEREKKMPFGGVYVYCYVPPRGNRRHGVGTYQWLRKSSLTETPRKRNCDHEPF